MKFHTLLYHHIHIKLSIMTCNMKAVYFSLFGCWFSSTTTTPAFLCLPPCTHTPFTFLPCSGVCFGDLPPPCHTFCCLLLLLLLCHIIFGWLVGLVLSSFCSSPFPLLLTCSCLLPSHPTCLPPHPPPCLPTTTCPYYGLGHRHIHATAIHWPDDLCCTAGYSW